MPNIQLPTGKTIYLSTYTFLFEIKDEEVDLFYQSCVADDLGSFIEDPFAGRSVLGLLEVDEPADLPEETPANEVPE
jgi:hypothetical protein